MIIALKSLGMLLLSSVSVLLIYNLFLALVSIFRKVAPRPDTESTPRFVVVIPAYNEAKTLPPTLLACERFDYPEDLYEIDVVADNCTDETAKVVREHGVRCLERTDPNHRGKGYALRWAFDQLLEEDHDVFVVLDADCSLEAKALRAFANEISGGGRVLQASYVVDNPDSTPISYAVAVGNIIENDLYYHPKSALGWVVVLRGTGMIFERNVLERFPWEAFSLVEDVDYSMSLYENGLAVRFLPWVEVRSLFPESFEQLRVQRMRWAGGNVQMGKGSVLRFLWKGISKQRVIYFDMGLTILSQSRPLQLVLLGLLYIVATLGFLGLQDHFFDSLFLASNVLVSGYILYFAWGVLRLGLSWRRLGLLVRTPGILVGLTRIAIRSVGRSREPTWERTPRG